MSKRKASRAQLPDLLQALHDRLVTELGIARRVIAHPSTKGDVTEGHWVKMLRGHLPQRYQINKAFVIDSRNQCSDQIDIVIHDTQYSPFVLNHDSAMYVPAESVYAVFESKPEMSGDELTYAAGKVASVRRLHRTNLPITWLGGTQKPRPLPYILGGLVCLESAWKPPFGGPLTKAISGLPKLGRLELSCVARHGTLEVDYGSTSSAKPKIEVHAGAAPLAYFVLRMIVRLQCMATVPCLDVMAYAKWLSDARVGTARPSRKHRRARPTTKRRLH